MPEPAAPISRREAVGLVVVLALLAGVAFRPSIRGNDGVGHFVYLSSILRDGDLDFSNDYRAFDAARQYSYRFADLPVSPLTGLPSNRYGIGSALLWAPFVMPAYWVIGLIKGEAPEPTGRALEWAVGLATVFWGSLGLILLYLRLRREWGRLASAGALSGLVLATPLGFYLYAHGSMAHGVSFFAATGAMLSAEKAWRRPAAGAMAAAGAWLALLMLIRVQDVTWAALIGAWLVWTALRRLDPEPCFAALGALAGVFALLFVPQVAVWELLYGSWLSGPTPYLDGSAGLLTPWPRHLLEALVSERGGVLAWHPIILLGLVGLVILILKRFRLVVMSVLGVIGFALTAWLVGCWSIWWAGASFGNRLFISCLPFLAPGIAWWMGQDRSPAARRVALTVLACLIIWNMGLLIQYATEMVPREEAVPWSQVIRQNVVDVPRYLFEKLGPD